jgi:hypothetical protein
VNGGRDTEWPDYGSSSQYALIIPPLIDITDRLRDEGYACTGGRDDAKILPFMFFIDSISYSWEKPPAGTKIAYFNVIFNLALTLTWNGGLKYIPNRLGVTWGRSHAYVDMRYWTSL